MKEWDFGYQEEVSILINTLYTHKQGTSAELRHVNIPDDAYDDIVDGWNESYFRSLQEFYED